MPDRRETWDNSYEKYAGEPRPEQTYRGPCLRCGRVVTIGGRVPSCDSCFALLTEDEKLGNFKTPRWYVIVYTKARAFGDYGPGELVVEMVQARNALEPWARFNLKGDGLGPTSGPFASREEAEKACPELLGECTAAVLEDVERKNRQRQAAGGVR